MLFYSIATKPIQAENVYFLTESETQGAFLVDGKDVTVFILFFRVCFLSFQNPCYQTTYDLTAVLFCNRLSLCPLLTNSVVHTHMV